MAYRMVVDYRALNRITEENRYPLFTIQELLDRVGRCSIYTSRDPNSAYNQVRIKEEDVHMTAFRTRFGHYESLVMNFGLCNAPAAWQRVANDALRPLGNQYVICYLDDILIFSHSFEEHAEHVRSVLQRLKEEQLYVKPSKCAFFQEHVPFLSHFVSAQGIEVDAKQTEAINKWPAPRCVKDLMSFLGAANFFRCFIRQMAHLSQPLTCLLRQDVPWTWGEAE